MFEIGVNIYYYVLKSCIFAEVEALLTSAYYKEDIRIIIEIMPILMLKIFQNEFNEWLNALWLKKDKLIDSDLSEYSFNIFVCAA